MNESIKPPETQGLSIGHIYYMLFRHKWTILTCFAGGLIASAVVFFITPTVYRSDAKLLLRYIADTTVLDPAAMSGGRIMPSDRYGDNMINSEIEILTSRDMVDQIVTELGDDRFMPEGAPKANHAIAVSFAMAGLNIEVPKRSSVFRLSFDASDPALARDFLNRLIQLYLQKHIEIHRAVGAYDFLAQQTDQIRSKLVETEEELRRIKSEAGVVSLSDDKKMLAARLEEMGKSLREAQSDLAASAAKISILHPILPTNTLTSAHSTNESLSVTPSIERLAKLQKTEADMLMIYTEDSSPVKNVREQIRTLMESLGPNAGIDIDSTSSLSTNVQSAFLAERANHASIEARIKTIRDQMDQTRKELSRLDAIESQITQLERSREIQGANYEYFAKGLEQARIDDALDSGKISNISIVQPASFPAQKVRPKLWRNMGMAAAFGLVLGLGLAFLQEEVFRKTLKNALQTEGLLGLPVILTIPMWLPAAGRRRTGKSEAASSPNGGVMPRGASRELLEGLKEYFETLRDRLSTTTNHLEQWPRVLGVTSCTPGGGSTTIAAGLALALARSSKDRVLLMDLDPAHGSAHRVFGVNPSSGLVDILADGQGNKALVERNLYLVPATPEETSTSLSVTERVRGMVEKMVQSNYDFIVLDMPPVSDISLALRTAGMIDAVVLVVENEKVDVELARRTRDLLLREKIKLMGVVLNKRRSYVPHWLHQMT